MDKNHPALTTGRTMSCPRCGGPRYFAPYPSGLRCSICMARGEVEAA